MTEGTDGDAAKALSRHVSTFTAFAGQRRIATGALHETLAATKACIDAGEPASVLVFEDDTGAQIDFDWRGTIDDVLARIPEHPAFRDASSDEKRSGPGRPKLGVVSREVSLLPRHWQWLEAQSGGISAALRRLVDEARKSHAATEDANRRRDAMSRFMWSMAGNLPDFEEASRALFASDAEAFRERIRQWPSDIREHLLRLASAAFV